MEHATVLLGKPEEYDKHVHGEPGLPSLRQGSDITLITKDHGTDAGKAIAVVSFTTEIGGKPYRCQATTTVAILQMMLAALNGRYEDGGKLRADLSVER
jgi:hypothetical protein